MEFLFLAAGILIGAVIMWLFLRSKTTANGSDPRTAQLEKENIELTINLEHANRAKNQLSANQMEATVRFESVLKETRTELEEKLHKERTHSTQLSEQLARRDTELRALEQRLQEQKVEIEKLQERFTKEFENLANKIFDEKSKKFTEQNRTQLDDLLKPFGEKIRDFEKKVTDVYNDENKERASLKGEISKLFDLNQLMAKEAVNLTRALKGDSKTQGNWGEFILESVLEKSGLQKDREYRKQQSFTNEEGKRDLPDFIIYLPDDKHLIIDSKVSLLAYERFISAETEEEKTLALKEHVLSVRKHIRELSEKKYQDLYQLNSLDFVLLFMPVEPAFALSIQSDAELFNDAFARNIVVVSPSTMLATLRTVANIWRQEHQNRNVLRIAEEAAAMYDKFVGFTDAMVEMGKRLNSSVDYYTDAMKRLSSGPGNVIKRIENLRKLGLKVNKEINPKLVERAEEVEEPNEKTDELP